VKIWLRAASVLTAVFTLGHSFGTFREPEGAQVPVATMMRAVSFDLLGFPRTYWGMFVGYGELMIVTGVLLVVLLWLLSGMAADQVRPLALAIAIAQAAFAVIAWRDFFWAPAALNGLSAVCAVIAVTTRRGSAP